MGLGRKSLVELARRDVAAFEPRPGVRVRVGGVHGADEVDRETVGDLVVPERFERARQDHAAEIPEHGPAGEGVGHGRQRSDAPCSGVRPWLTGRRYATSRRRRRFQHRHRGSVHAEPLAAQRGGDGVHGGATRRPHHRRRRCHLRSSHRAEGGEGVRRGGRQQRARRASRRRHRPRRRLRALDRQQGRGHDPHQRLLSGVPRSVRLAVRRGSPHRRQTGPTHRLGVRAKDSGARCHQSWLGEGREAQARRPGHGRARRSGCRPSGQRRRQPSHAGAQGSAARVAPVRCRCVRGCSDRGGDRGRCRHQRARRTRRASWWTGTSRSWRSRAAGAAAAAADGSVAQCHGRERPVAVPVVRRAPPGGQQRECDRRELLVSRRLRARGRGEGLRAVAPDG